MRERLSAAVAARLDVELFPLAVVVVVSLSLFFSFLPLLFSSSLPLLSFLQTAHLGSS